MLPNAYSIIASAAASVTLDVGDDFLRSEYAIFVAWLSRSTALASPGISPASSATPVISVRHIVPMLAGFEGRDASPVARGVSDGGHPQGLSPLVGINLGVEPMDIAQADEALARVMADMIMGAVTSRPPDGPAVCQDQGEDADPPDAITALSSCLQSLVAHPHTALRALVSDHGLLLDYPQFARTNMPRVCMKSAMASCVVVELSHVIDRLSAWILGDDHRAPALGRGDASIASIGVQTTPQPPPVFKNKANVDVNVLVASGITPIWGGALPTMPPAQNDNGAGAGENPSALGSAISGDESSAGHASISEGTPLDRTIRCMLVCVAVMLACKGMPTYKATHNGRIGEFNVDDRLSEYIGDAIPFAFPPKLGIAVARKVYERVAPKEAKGFIFPTAPTKGADLDALVAFIKEHCAQGHPVYIEMCGCIS